MSSTRMSCPGCGAAITSAEPVQAGRLAECPYCRLLFTPSPGDLLWTAGRGAARAAELAWAEDDVPRPYPRPSPFDWRRRFRRLTARELAAVLLACSIMMVLAGIVMRTYSLVVGRQPAGTATTVAPTPNPQAGSPAESLVEVEDDHPPPRQQVPSLDEPPS